VSIIKSFSIGNGDMFYINHGSDNFTVIDCYLSEDNKVSITDEILRESRDKGITMRIPEIYSHPFRF
jgi:hypothetical protein